MPRYHRERHRTARIGWLRAAVLGANDGIVSTASLVLGMAAAQATHSNVVVAGVAGLVAGAMSMAAGEYVSVRSQREMYEHQIGLEQAELDEYPDEEAEELALIYAARGMSTQDATELSRRTIADPRQALATLAREELGLNPEELGSPWGAALSSFFSFAVGALVPLLPFLLVRAEGALPYRGGCPFRGGPPPRRFVVSVCRAPKWPRDGEMVAV